jgi:hypothetical protein
MSTIGNKAATQHVSLQKQTITGNGGTSYSLQQSVGSALDIAVFVNNTRQEPAIAYSASGTTLTMTGAVNASDSFYVIFLGKAITTTALPVDVVGTANINAGAVDLTSKVTGILPAANGGTAGTSGGGKILQAEFSSTNANQNATTSWTGTGLSDSITMTSASNKVLIMCSANGYMNGGNYYNFDIVRHSSALAAGDAEAGTRLFGGNRGMGSIYGNTGDRFNTITGLMLDTPGAGTFHYSLVHKEYSGSGIFNHSNPTSSIVLLEIKA